MIMEDLARSATNRNEPAPQFPPRGNLPWLTKRGGAWRPECPAIASPVRPQSARGIRRACPSVCLLLCRRALPVFGPPDPPPVGDAAVPWAAKVGSASARHVITGKVSHVVAPLLEHSAPPRSFLLWRGWSSASAIFCSARARHSAEV